MKKLKRIAAMICVIALCFCVSAPSSHAQGAIAGQQFGAWIASALVSLNLVGQVINGATVQEGIDAFHQLQHFMGVPTIQELASDLPTPYDVYTFDDSAVSEALNTSIIKIRKGVTTIDGVPYDELWVSPEGAQKLKTNAFDFITKYNLIANDTSTLMRGLGSFDGIPFYGDGTVNSRTQTYDFAGAGHYEIGNMTLDPFLYNNTLYFAYHYSDGTGSNNAGIIYPPYQMYIQAAEVSGSTIDAARLYVGHTRNGTFASLGMVPRGLINNETFKYNFVSGIIPAQESIPDDYGLSVKVPSDDMQNFYQVYPQYDADESIINVQEDGVDINVLTNAIFDYIDSMQDIKSEWTNGEQPEPPAPVDPIENIDHNVEDISQYQADMQQQVDHIHQDVEAIHQTQQAQQQTQQDIAETSESIDNTLKEVKDAVKPGEVTPKKFDLRRLFPFCIPFDIYNFLQKFDAEPQAPHVQLPFVIESIGFEYMIDLDFSTFDGLAQTLRTLELIVYCLGLAWATSKVIKW